MHAVTAVSGSGPAYVFLLIEALAAAGAAAGLPADLADAAGARARSPARASWRGSRAEPRGQLRPNVTSPGGTTAAALARADGRGRAAGADGAGRGGRGARARASWPDGHRRRAASMGMRGMAEDERESGPVWPWRSRCWPSAAGAASASPSWRAAPACRWREVYAELPRPRRAADGASAARLDAQMLELDVGRARRADAARAACSS